MWPAVVSVLSELVGFKPLRKRCQSAFPQRFI